MFSVIQNIFKIEDLRNRVIFTLMMLVFFRAGTYIPIPGIDTDALAELFNSQIGNILSFFNTFSGGALRNLSIFALGIIPYISASIIMQIMTAVIPTLERIAQEGEDGRRKISQYTRYLTIVLSLFQGFGIVTGITNLQTPTGRDIVITDLSYNFFIILSLITLTAGTAFVMWMGEKINERGIGNGMSIIVFTGIVADIPIALIRTLQLFQTGEIAAFIIILVGILIIAIVWGVVFVESAERKIPVNYAKKVIRNRMYGGQSSYLPFKVNVSGVIPLIFASSLLAFPSSLTAFVTTPWVQSFGQQLVPGEILHSIIFSILIFFFAFFYVAIQYNPLKISEDLKQGGGFVPGVRPGQKTADYLNLILTRLTVGGAIYLCVISLIPNFLYNAFNLPFFFGGAALLIVVSVALDTVKQVETFLVYQNYEGFIKKKRKKKY
jgi:preprotein translocase subunit SecY